MQRSREELVRRVYDVQKEDSSPGDFVELVIKDKGMINLSMADEEIERLKKAKFKSILKSKIKQAAYKSLNAQKEKHSKMNGLVYKKLEKAEYLGTYII